MRQDAVLGFDDAASVIGDLDGDNAAGCIPDGQARGRPHTMSADQRHHLVHAASLQDQASKQRPGSCPVAPSRHVDRVAEGRHARRMRRRTPPTHPRKGICNRSGRPCWRMAITTYRSCEIAAVSLVCPGLARRRGSGHHDSRRTCTPRPGQPGARALARRARSAAGSPRTPGRPRERVPSISSTKCGANSS